MLGNVTIPGAADDVWIFRIDGDLIGSNAFRITLEGGAMWRWTTRP